MASPITTVTEFFKRMTGGSKPEPTPEPAKPEPVAEKVA
jgi:hypothetical protein